MSQVSLSHSHMMGVEKQLHRPCSSCISSIENLIETPLSSHYFLYTTYTTTTRSVHYFPTLII